MICIDGPTASGKGTVAASVAERLGYHFWTPARCTASPAWPRCGPASHRAPTTKPPSPPWPRQLPVRVAGSRIWLGDDDVSEAIRTEEAGMNASRVSALPCRAHRAGRALQQLSRLPGLVADGRDMGTVIFPTAPLKVFSDGQRRLRAERRL